MTAINIVNDLTLRYLDIWNERDAAARDSLIKTVLTEDSIYTDPDYASLRGHAELSNAIGEAHQKLGNLEFSLDTVISAHHDTALFTWRLSERGSTDAVATGYDVVEFAGDRIRRVVGYFV